MDVSVNDEIHELQEGCTVTDLLDHVGTEIRGIAVAQNNIVVPRNQWESTTIQEGDNIMIIQATQGG